MDRATKNVSPKHRRGDTSAEDRQPQPRSVPSCKFIHAADIHIDSPLVGLEAQAGMPVERLRQATRAAFENVVRLALDERVGFVIIAGDLFDGTWRDMKTGLWTAAQFRRLKREGIDVYLVRGNHDALSQVRRAISWPENVHEFAVRKAETLVREDLGVAIHGRSFPDRQVTEDLAASYPSPVTGLLNIGVLHTSLTGTAAHDTYAPTSESVLVGRGYDYWALGHIHARQVICEDPYIAFAGCTQGRHINERGAKGCLLVTFEDREIRDVQFRATDVVRWQLAEIELGESQGVAELLADVRREFGEIERSAEGRFAAVRLAVRGRCAAHNELAHRGRRAEVVAEVRNLAAGMDENLCLEQIRFETSAPVDLDQLRQGQDLLGELLRRIEQLGGDTAPLAELAAALEPLNAQLAGPLQQAGIDVKAAANLRRWLRDAEGLLVAQLLEADE
jgi:exonuclease SbcD